MTAIELKYNVPPEKFEQFAELLKQINDLLKYEKRAPTGPPEPWSPAELKKRRVNLQYGLRYVSKHTSVSVSTISRIERGFKAEHVNVMALHAFYNLHEELL
jgi:hypothetical protein